MNENIDNEQLEPGFVLGKYRIVRFISEGSMGRVYEAEHTILQSRHALKVIRKFLAMNPYFISKFRYEARLMAALDHENIVRVTDYGQEKGFSFFVMDYVQGPQSEPLTLQSEINLQAGKGLDEHQVKEMALQICDALNYAHGFQGEGIVHRDLKPGNILLRDVSKKHLRVVVTDFGLARMLSEDDSLQSMAVQGDGSQGTIVISDASGVKIKTDEISGTPAYMAPEQWTPGAEIGPASDMYSLGVMLYKLLTGKMPFIDSRSLMGERNEAPPAKPSSFGVSKDWDPILDRCLQAEASDRYSTAAELREGIAAVGEKKTSSGLFSRVFTLLLLAGLAAAVGWMVLQYRNNPEHSLLSKVLPQPTPPQPVAEPTEPPPPPTPTPAPTRPPPTPTPVPPAVGMLEISLGKPESGSTVPYLPPTAKMKSGDGPWTLISLPHLMEWPVEKALDLELQIKGFEANPRTFPEVNKDVQQRVVFDIVPKRVPLRFTSNVPEASVYMNDESLGKIGDIIQLAPFTKQAFEFRAPGYNTEKVFLEALDPSRDYTPRHVELKAIPAHLEIIGHYPAIALGDRKVDIYFNERHVGNHQLPHSFYNVTPGDYKIRIEGKDWVALPEKTITLDRGETGQVEFQFEYTTASVNLTLSPAHAQLLIAGKEIKERHLELRPGLHKLQVIADTYAPRTIALNVKPGETKDLKITLNRMTLFDFKITPANASIYMKGKKIAPGRVPVNPSTAYLVTIRADGYKNHQGTYRARKGEVKVIEVKLKKKFF